jgi:hypothetical protein
MAKMSSFTQNYFAAQFEVNKNNSFEWSRRLFSFSLLNYEASKIHFPPPLLFQLFLKQGIKFIKKPKLKWGMWCIRFAP